MIAVIMQPTYLPWIGYFHLMDQGDIFVLLDNVQFEKQSWQQRNRIKTPNGPQWLSLPVGKKFPQSISEAVLVDRPDWRDKHWKSIAQTYRKAPFWAMHGPGLEALYSREWVSLADLNIALIDWLRAAFGIATPMVRASGLPVAGKRVDLLLSICAHLGADTYLSPAGAADYIEEDNRFSAHGITLLYQRYAHPRYPQINGPFASHMAAIDLLFNQGPESLRIIREGGLEPSPTPPGPFPEPLS